MQADFIHMPYCRKVYVSSIVFLIFVYVSIAFIVCSASVAEDSAYAGLSQATQKLAQAGRSASGSEEKLNNLAREIADIAGLSSLLRELEQMQQEHEVGLDSQSLKAVTQRQRLIYLREKLNTLVQALNLQINATRGKVDKEIARADETRAYLTEKRNRITHRNSQVNLLSGGVTKIVGYSIALSKITDIPTNVLEVFDGGVQTTLTGLALRQERQESKLEHGMPALLETFISEKGVELHYPQSVWRYMNESDPNKPSSLSRRQQLINSWQKTGIVARTKEASMRQRTKPNMSIELLDQRMAMLSDLKSVIEEMHFGLMQLNDAIVVSYKYDPVW